MKNNTEAAETNEVHSSAPATNYSPRCCFYHTYTGYFLSQPASAPPAPKSSFDYFPYAAAQTCNRSNYNTTSTYTHYGYPKPGYNQNLGYTDKYRDRCNYNGFGRNAEPSSCM